MSTVIEKLKNYLKNKFLPGLNSYSNCLIYQSLSQHLISYMCSRILVVFSFQMGEFLVIPPSSLSISTTGKLYRIQCKWYRAELCYALSFMHIHSHLAVFRLSPASPVSLQFNISLLKVVFNYFSGRIMGIWPKQS